MPRKRVDLSKDYLDALKNYWEGRPRTAIETLSQVLAENPEHPGRCRLYRFWIEILAELDEFDALRAMAWHLFGRSVAGDKTDVVSFMALRGIAYYELDEVNSARFFANVVAKYPANEYARELMFLVKQRVSSKKRVFKANRSSDYFHLQREATCYLQTGEESKVDRVLKKVARLFPGSPMECWFRMHRSIRDGYLHRASQYALRLFETYPAQLEYSFYAAYCLSKVGKEEIAIEILQKALEVASDRDVDMLRLLAQCYTNLFIRNEDKKMKTNAMQTIAKIKEWFDEDTVTPLGINYLLYQLKDHDGELKLNNPWIVKLNGADFHEMRTAPEVKMQKIKRQLDESASAGDIVFFVGDDYRSENSWRLAAVYKVDVDPSWHPVDGFHCLCTLISRPQNSIPIAVENLTNEKIVEDVVLLDWDSVDLISDILKEFRSEDKGASKILRVIEKAG